MPGGRQAEVKDPEKWQGGSRCGRASSSVLRRGLSELQMGRPCPQLPSAAHVQEDVAVRQRIDHVVRLRVHYRHPVRRHAWPSRGQSRRHSSPLLTIRWFHGSGLSCPRPRRAASRFRRRRSCSRWLAPIRSRSMSRDGARLPAHCRLSADRRQAERSAGAPAPGREHGPEYRDVPTERVSWGRKAQDAD